VKLPRPYVPLRVRVAVAERQFFEIHKRQPSMAFMKTRILSQRVKLEWLLVTMFGSKLIELHHRPALLNRSYVNGKYHPDANDPAFLVYLPADDHAVETRVRGQHGDYSDLAKRRKAKRIAQKTKRPRSRLRSRGFDKTRTRHFDGTVTPRKGSS
jgi:hypothetical protein